MSRQSEWEQICKKYCETIGAELLFANVENGDFGYELNGQFAHLTADELAARLEARKAQKQ